MEDKDPLEELINRRLAEDPQKIEWYQWGVPLAIVIIVGLIVFFRH